MNAKETSKETDAGSYLADFGAEVHPAEFVPLGAGDAASASNMDLLLDIILKVDVELGRSSMAVREILTLGPGSVVELDRMAGEPVDVSINGTLVARGEVVVVDEKFGVRVTEIVTPAKRLAALG